MNILDDLISSLDLKVGGRDIRMGLFHMEDLLALCSPKAYVVVLGDTAPLTPILFSYGIDAVCGTKVVNPELVLRCVSEGATYRQIKGIAKLIIKKS